MKKEKKYFINIKEKGEKKMKVVVNEKKLKVVVDEEVYKNIFNEDVDCLMLEVEMIIDGIVNNENVVEFVKSKENDYEVYLNNVKYEFDF